MPWRYYHTKLSTHVAPEDDTLPHEFIDPCWCGAERHPEHGYILHTLFSSTDSFQFEDIIVNPEMTEQ